jgi:DNA replication protein DnaC
MSTATPESPSTEQLDAQLAYLKLLFIQEHYAALSQEAVQAHWGYVDYLAALIAGEALLHQERSVQRRIRQARFPVIKTLEQFQWSWPRKINRLQVQELFRLKFIEDKANVMFLGGVGVGKTHLAPATLSTDGGRRPLHTPGDCRGHDGKCRYHDGSVPPFRSARTRAA